MEIAAFILIFLMTVVLHEVAHGAVAHALGDPTARNAGRLTLNPLKHIDLFWTVLFPGMLFFATAGRFAIGMAKPVPVDFSRLGKPKRDMIWVALAGPAANFIIVLILAMIRKTFPHDYLLFGIYLNLGLGIFNLIPIPPLDGSRILAGILPNPAMRFYLRLEPYGFLIVLGLYFLGVLTQMVMPLLNAACGILGVPRLSVSF